MNGDPQDEQIKEFVKLTEESLDRIDVAIARIKKLREQFWAQHKIK